MASRSYTACHLLIALGIVGCGNGSTTVTLPDDVSRHDIFAYDSYYPFQRDAILDDPEAIYGEPDDSGRLFESRSSHLDYKEYRCKHGWVRVCNVYGEDDNGSHTERMLEFYPAKGTANDLIRREFLTSYDPRDAGHSLVFCGGRTRGIVLLNIENGFVTQVLDRDW